ncbi:hypothetical protein Rhe02_55640 [Rhizocola hellebori]|uniref:Uncharacterized protein n=1 Tax=Rhizocola hellebori TaxID=1392758 RepID=A0A8J3VIK6_9ACTN|nr:hypothetical protein [Rhizocola hellebori]GIH07497.1 hypothetical protein Rhe02_55640 [Rhizocola hellebori]
MGGSLMDLASVMDELAVRLRSISGLQVFEWPVSPVTPPAALLTYPDSIDFDETYGRGMDRMRALPLVVIGGKPTTIDARNMLSALTAGSGERSIKAVLESGTYTAFDEIRVAKWEFDVIEIAANPYMAAIAMLDIGGQGA